MKIRECIPLRAARLALDEAIVQLRQSVHPGSVKQVFDSDGVELAESVSVHLNRIRMAMSYWEECKAYHDASLEAGAKAIAKTK